MLPYIKYAVKGVLVYVEFLKISELVQLKLNIESSVGESTPTEAENGGPLPLVEVGVSLKIYSRDEEGKWGIV